MNLRKKLVCATVGLMLAGLTLAAGATPAAKPTTPTQMPTSTTGY